MKYFLENPTIVECLRIREKLNTTYFGKIYRDPKDTKTLKTLGLKKVGSIVVQLLPEPEELDEKSLVLLLCKRNIESKTYD